MRVLILGDVHGEHQCLAQTLRQAQLDFGIAAAIQVGDFGFTRDAMQRARASGIRYPVPLHVIDGNHEDHHWLWQALWTGAVRVWEQEAGLIYQPRPSVTRLGGSTVGFMGGALHVDRPQRHNLLSRFPNYILRQQCEQAVLGFNREQPELIVTHSCPSGIGIGLESADGHGHGVALHIAAAGFDPGPQDDCGEAELTRLWRALTYRPQAWVFGHFHRAHRVTIEGTRFVCVAEETASPARELVLWDTEEKKVLICPADPSTVRE